MVYPCDVHRRGARVVVDRENRDIRQQDKAARRPDSRRSESATLTPASAPKLNVHGWSWSMGNRSVKIKMRASMVAPDSR